MMDETKESNVECGMWNEQAGSWCVVCLFVTLDFHAIFNLVIFPTSPAASTITYTVNEGLPTAFLQGRSLVENDVLFGM